MAITRKPKKEEKNVDAVISRGGSVPGEDRSNREVKQFPMRMEARLIAMIDDLVNDNPAIPSRNSWIIGAVVDKLKKEGKLE